jgi:hypothetical protein
MKTIFTVLLLTTCSFANAIQCNMDFTTGYECNTDSEGLTMLVLNSMYLENGKFVCASENIAFFAKRKKECLVSAYALINHSK